MKKTASLTIDFFLFLQRKFKEFPVLVVVDSQAAAIVGESIFGGVVEGGDEAFLPACLVVDFGHTLDMGVIETVCLFWVQIILSLELVDATAKEGAVLIELEPEGDGAVAARGHLFRPGVGGAVDETLQVPPLAGEGGDGVGIVAVDGTHTGGVDVVGDACDATQHAYDVALAVHQRGGSVVAAHARVDDEALLHGVEDAYGYRCILSSAPRLEQEHILMEPFQIVERIVNTAVAGTVVGEMGVVRILCAGGQCRGNQYREQQKGKMFFHDKNVFSHI